MEEDLPPFPRLISEAPAPKLVPERFLVAKRTLRFDRFMTHAIKIGGLSIIVAVFGMFVFILSQILPLFRGAAVVPLTEADIANPAAALALGIDEWAELPFVYYGGNEIFFADLHGDRGTFGVPIPMDLDPGERISAIRYDPGSQRVTLGTSIGRVGSFTVLYRPHFDDDGKRTIVPEIEPGPYYLLGGEPAPVVDVDYGDSGSAKLIVALQVADGKPRLRAFTLKQKRTLLGAGEIERDRDFDFDFAADLRGNPRHLLVTSQADAVLVATDAGEVAYFFIEDGELGLRQKFTPFADLENPGIARMDFVLGDVSVVFNGDTGEQRVFSLFRPGDEPTRHFGETKRFPPLPGPATFFVASQRNKTFLTGTENLAVLQHSTTESVRWKEELPFKIQKAAIDGKFETIAFLDTGGMLHLYSLRDPHPEAGWKAFFGKVWYEGASKPEYVWQSTGGTDDFEPKLSMTPLLIGSLKGTLYAMLFAVPIALLSAAYTSQFLHPPIKQFIKPTMEIMASLPSVVLGFLAALWLAPIIETRIPSLLLILISLPVAALLFGRAWSALPITWRNRVRPGHEYAIFAPLMLVIMVAMWRLGPAFEEIAFVVSDPATGKSTADFRLWWPEVTGTPFDQRNSLVVGFMMGFAVIPIIFTIAEDALSNVPSSLTAASAALGASRWQTVRTIVIPIASAGIFSALMIGFGRAVGETMIVVMATGNTPVMDWNIFSGMRTLSANIAVELPEAPVHSTHYRTLFLGAVVLFLLTFVVNTFAEILRQHLRERFKLI